MMAATISAGARRHHAVLAERLASVLGASSASGSGGALLRTAEDPAPAGPAPCLTLERTARCRLERLAERGRFHLAYRDPAGETALAAALAALTAPGQPIAADPESLSILALAERLAASEIPVLISGPTGTGKEVLSRFIHESSPRRNGPFIAVNCAAMPETMLEAMLFGHQKGAFTGATQASEGFFRAADGGTLFLDEIAEMPLALQAKLLRALQEGEVVPIGATRPVRVDVRIVAAANRDLPSEVAAGRFREDLFYRLNVFPLALKPLRERAADIAPLAFAMLLRHAPAHRPLPWLGEAALAKLKLHAWPGNVRELENVIRRALLLADGAEEIGAAQIMFDQPARLASAPARPQFEPRNLAEPRRLADAVQRSEAETILEVLDAVGGNRVAAARELGISERTLRYRLAAFREAGLAIAGAGR